MSVNKKIVILGNFGVGKTSLIRKFVTNEFSSDYKVTIGVHVLKKDVIINKKVISLLLWDLEGFNNLKKISKAYLSGSSGYIYIYDVMRPSSYENLEQDIDFLKTNFNTNNIKVVANKSDLLTEKEYQHIKSSSYKPDFFSSAKTGENVEAIFKSIAKN